MRLLILGKPFEMPFAGAGVDRYQMPSEGKPDTVANI